MSRAAFGVLILMTMGVMGVVVADLAPFPGPRPVPSRPTSLPGAGATMKSAVVAVDLRHDVDAGATVLADVVCDFELQYPASARRAPYQVTFPVCTKDDPATVPAFAVEVDGTKIKEAPVQQNVFIPVNDTRETYRAYSWYILAAPAQVQKVAVKYQMRMPVKDGLANFRYVLRSGSTWAGPIGQETVTVKVPATLGFVQAANSLPATSARSGVWTWTLANARPTKDIVGTIAIPKVVPATPPAKN